MKLTKNHLKQLIRETLEEQYGDDEFAVGQFVEVRISDDGYDVDVTVVKEEEFNPTRGYTTSAKFLAKIVKVAELEDDEY